MDHAQIWVQMWVQSVKRSVLLEDIPVLLLASAALRAEVGITRQLRGQHLVTKCQQVNAQLEVEVMQVQLRVKPLHVAQGIFLRPALQPALRYRRDIMLQAA